MDQVVIGCDIGGVVKNQMTQLPIENAIETLKDLSVNGNFRVIFISKCKESYQEKSELWLKEHGLNHIQAFYCLDYKDKIEIAKRENVRIMIDDKIQVLSTFDENIVKIWLCNEEKKISGTKKFQPELFNTLSLAMDWTQVLEIINNYQN